MRVVGGVKLADRLSVLFLRFPKSFPISVLEECKTILALAANQEQKG